MPSGQKHAFESVGQENSQAQQTHYRSHCLEHLQASFPPCARENTSATLHSQKDSGKASHIPEEVGISSNRCLEREQHDCVKPRKLTACAGNH